VKALYYMLFTNVVRPFKVAWSDSGEAKASHYMCTPTPSLSVDARGLG